MNAHAYRAHPTAAQFGRDIVEPTRWQFDGGVRRESVIDPNWNDRIVRKVGWRTCMHCRDWFFSPDVARVRLHTNCGDADHGII